MGDVIDGLKNHSTREAKDFAVSRIVEEAQHEGTPLSELERKIEDVIIRSFVTVVKSLLLYLAITTVVQQLLIFGRSRVGAMRTCKRRCSPRTIGQ